MTMLPKLSDALKLLEVSAVPRAVAGGGKWIVGRGADLVAQSPIDGSQLAVFPQATPEQMAEAVGQAHAAFLEWRTVPAPQRGHFVRRLGELLREHKENLATIVAWEAGKITQEALGEVQEM